MDKKIFSSIDYGYIENKFSELLDKMKISKYQFCQMTGIRRETVNAFYNKSITRLDIDSLAKMCYVFNCKVEDIITYVKPEEK